MKRTTRLRPYAIPMLVVSVVAVAVTAFTWPDEDDYHYKLNRSLELFGQVYREISQSYVDQVEPDEFIAAGINGMLKTLDPYTVYLRKKEAADIDLLTNGSYGGIGISVGWRDSSVTIVDVMDGYSAQREGIRIGDKILSINGVELLHVPLDSLREYTRGEPNTTLQISVLREGVEQPLDFTLTRDNIRVRSISYSGVLDGGIGYVKLDRFNASAGEELRAAILELKSKGATNGLILDLRDNPGGLLESAVDVGAKFLPAGSTIVTTRGRDSNDQRSYKSTETPIADDLPLVVLVNEGSASAAEIVAGAIQDLDAGVIMGTQSYGKGLVQSVRRLSHDATLKMTTARYYTPSGRCIQKIDYGHGRGGSIVTLPDGRSYHTRNGRLVLQGGGILPDTIVAGPDTTSIVERLRNGSVFFRFATRYTSGMRTLPPGFKVDDALLRQFEGYAATALANSSEASAAVAEANQLLAAARSEGYSREMMAKIESLRGEIIDQERTLMSAHRDEIRRALQAEIHNRFRGQRERMESEARDDRQVRAAAGLLRSGQRSYAALLSSR